ncbi:hypothetical protein [Haloechinothrix salitolerans]|uniref:Uncharacterized protein n=1 Tax=Haloechinothrix salitolerans TaxID=926830 RepID=A0ABW2BT56_9PSEU
MKERSSVEGMGHDDAGRALNDQQHRATEPDETAPGKHNDRRTTTVVRRSATAPLSGGAVG